MNDTGRKSVAGDVAISVTNLTKRFGTVTAVDKVSFSVDRGEAFAFLGPNGAGKTTTIRMLTTLLDPDEGAIVLDGHDVGDDPDAVRRSFGIVFQDPSLDTELTARENMALHAALYGIPKKEAKERVTELLEFVELVDRADDFVKQFSGGMKRRLEIARGLLHSPSILFLDEPTLGLDPQTRLHLWKYIADLREQKGMTVFFTTHYMEEAERMAGRVAVIDHGHIVAEGTPESLKDQTKTGTLEEAFLSLTGRSIRDEEASNKDAFRLRARIHGRR